MSEMKAMRDAVGEALLDIAQKNPKVVVLDADVCTSTKTCYVRDKLPSQFLEIGIAEANMIGISAGLAAVGFIPFPVTFAVFASSRVADQVRMCAAHARLNVKIVGSYGGIPTGKAGATHSSVEDIAIMRAIPNMQIVIPADGVEVKKVIEAAAEIPGPFYISTVRCEVPTIFPVDHKFILGKGVVLQDGRDITVIGTGMMTARAKEAEEALKKKGISARVVHMPTIKPIDRELIKKCAEETKGIITIENHSVIGGLGGAVAEVACEASPCRIKRLGIPDTFVDSGEDEDMFAKFGMTADAIADAAERLLAS